MQGWPLSAGLHRAGIRTDASTVKPRLSAAGLSSPVGARHLGKRSALSGPSVDEGHRGSPGRSGVTLAVSFSVPAPFHDVSRSCVLVCSCVHHSAFPTTRLSPVGFRDTWGRRAPANHVARTYVYRVWRNLGLSEGPRQMDARGRSNSRCGKWRCLVSGPTGCPALADTRTLLMGFS